MRSPPHLAQDEVWSEIPICLQALGIVVPGALKLHMLSQLGDDLLHRYFLRLPVTESAGPEFAGGLRSQAAIMLYAATAGVGVLSALIALLIPDQGSLAGVVYFLVAAPAVVAGTRVGRRRRLEARTAS